MVNRAHPDADYTSDLYACQLEAARAYPMAMKTQHTSGTISQNCYAVGSQAYCNGTYTPPEDVSTGIDANATNRALSQFSCMSARGWRWEKQTTVSERSTQAAPSALRSELRLGYVVGYDIAKAIQRFADQVDNAPLFGGIDDGFRGQIVLTSEELARLRVSFKNQTAGEDMGVSVHPQWSAHPVVPSITDESPLRTRYSYMVGVDIATRTAGVAEFIDVGMLKIALVDTLAGRPIISEEEAVERRRALHDLVQARAKRR
jgi:hypothetical protein